MLIKIFQTKNGKEPFIHWLEKIKDKNTQARIRQRIRRLEAGNFGDFKPLGKNLYELRLDFGPGYRVYCVKNKENSEEVIFLLLGGNKKTQEKDILKARKILKL
ncbi:MAG: type II toxin-antitoxin system RelE/ParE family toxin [Patescibacteria group bacterium]